MVSLAVLVVGYPGAAAADAANWYLGGQVTYLEPDDDRLTENGVGPTLRLGRHFGEHFDLEAVGSVITLDREFEPRHEYIYSLGLEGLLVFNRGGFSPHLSLGGGVVQNDTTFDDGTGGYASAGFGFRAPIVENGLMLRFDARYVHDFTSDVTPGADEFDDFRVSLGLEVPLGGTAYGGNDDEGIYRPGKWYLAGQVSYVYPGDDRLNREGIGPTLRVGRQLSDWFDLELVGSQTTFERDEAGIQHEYLYSLGFEGLLVLNRGGFSPHLALGGGAVYNETSFDDGTGGYASVGLGVRVPIIEDGLKLRFDARYFEDFTDDVVPGADGFSDVRLSLGIEVPLGRGAPLDSDADGVADLRDKCPNTPPGTPVDAEGCALDSDSDGVPDYRDQCPNSPAGVPVGTDGCPLDSDGDGVPDSRDQCPNTPAGARVDATGCLLVVDSDGDGVPDDRDMCPGTPPGQPVLTNGCAVGQSAILQGVNFEFDKAVLTQSAREILRQVASTLLDSPGFGVELRGHTDAIGSASYNLDLSQRRAASVKRFLVAQGVDASRLSTSGFGETMPIATNETDAGRATNRRVELRIVDQR